MQERDLGLVRLGWCGQLQLAVGLSVMAQGSVSARRRFGSQKKTVGISVRNKSIFWKKRKMENTKKKKKGESQTEVIYQVYKKKRNVNH